MTPDVLARPPLRPYCTNDRPYFGPGSHVEALHAKSHAQTATPAVTPVPDAPPPLREVQVIDAAEARVLSVAALADAGMCAADAQQVADALVETSLCGIDTHGLRLLPKYLDELATGAADATATIRVLSDRGAGLLIDADGALGVVAGLAAAGLAAQRAAKFGVAAVAVRNSNDFAAVSVYTRQLARDGLVGVAVPSAPAPDGGVETLFGTHADADGRDLATAASLLGGVLTGAPTAGYLILALDPGAFGGQAHFGAGLAGLLAGHHPGAPVGPRRERTTIRLDARTAEVLSSLAAELEVPGPRSVFVD
jgi:LDH2 family malate/lactate/ureidoglycolate dehydrogenase